MKEADLCYPFPYRRTRITIVCLWQMPVWNLNLNYFFVIDHSGKTKPFLYSILLEHKALFVKSISYRNNKKMPYFSWWTGEPLISIWPPTPCLLILAYEFKDNIETSKISIFHFFIFTKHYRAVNCYKIAYIAKIPILCLITPPPEY